MGARVRMRTSPPPEAGDLWPVPAVAVLSLPHTGLIVAGTVPRVLPLLEVVALSTAMPTLP